MTKPSGGDHRAARAADAVPGTIVDGELVPDWLGIADVPWLRELLLQASAFDGEPFAALASAWRRSDVPPRAGPRWRPVLATLRTLLLTHGERRALAVQARQLRAMVFAAAANSDSRADALSAAASACGLTVAAVESSLFADVEAPSRVRWLAELDADGLRRAANGHFAGALLATADEARLVLHGASRAVLRTAWLHGACFQLAAPPTQRARELAAELHAELQWRATTGDAHAGRRLAHVLPVLPWARRYELRAACRWRGQRATVVLSSLDALPVGAAPAPFDSTLERDVGDALVRTFGPSGGQLVREPAPVPCGPQLAFPDFALVLPGGGAAWWLEVAGLRDPSALSGKLQLLVSLPNYVLCVPRARCPEAWIAHPRVVPFARGRRGLTEVVAGVQRVVAVPRIVAGDGRLTRPDCAP